MEGTKGLTYFLLTTYQRRVEQDNQPVVILFTTFNKDAVIVGPTGKNEKNLDVHTVLHKGANHVCLLLQLVHCLPVQEGRWSLTGSLGVSSVDVEGTFHPSWAWQKHCFLV